MWCSNKKNVNLPVPFFGVPFQSISNVQYDCVHGGEKKIHKKRNKDIEVN